MKEEEPSIQEIKAIHAEVEAEHQSNKSLAAAIIHEPINVSNIIPNASLNNSISAAVSQQQQDYIAGLNSDYLRRRYRKRHENPEKIKELLSEQVAVVENLSTAVESKMDVAVIGVLHGILLGLESTAENTGYYSYEVSSFIESS